MFRALAALVTGRVSRWFVIAAWIALLAIFAPMGGKLRGEIEQSATTLLPKDSESRRVLDKLQNDFPRKSNSAAIVLYRRSTGLEPRDARRIAVDAKRMAGVPLVKGPLPAFGAGEVPQRNVVNPALGSLDGTSAIVVDPFQAGSSEDVNNSIKKLRAIGTSRNGLEVHVTGPVAILNDIDQAVSSTDVALLLITILIVLTILVAVYRSPVLALVPVITVGVAYAVTQGVLEVLVKNDVLKVDSASVSLLLALMFGAGTDYCLLLVGRYSADLRRTPDARQALAGAIPRAGPAILASGITVMLALLALLVSKLDVNRSLGPVTAIGIGVVLLASLTLLPAILSVLGRAGFWPSKDKVAPVEAAGARPPAPLLPGLAPLPVAIAEQQLDAHPTVGLRDSIWRRVGAQVVAQPRQALVGVTLILVIGALGLFTYHQNVRPIDAFRKTTDSTKGYHLLEKALAKGAVSPTQVVVTGRGGPPRALDMERILKVLYKDKGIAAVTRGADPTSNDGRSQSLTLSFTDDPFKQPAFDRVDRFRAAFAKLPPTVSATIGDGTASRLDYKNAVSRDFEVVVPLVLALVFLMLVILLRALVAPLVVLGTVILSFLGSLGISMLVFKGFFNQDGVDPLTLTFIFIFLVALGTDYNIFLMSRVREEALEHGTREGMLRALAATGPVITSAGLVLAATFAVLMTLPLNFLLEAGFAVALGVLIDTFLVRTLLLPALVSMLGEKIWWPSSGPGGRRAPVVSGAYLRPEALERLRRAPAPQPDPTYRASGP